MAFRSTTSAVLLRLVVISIGLCASALPHLAARDPIPDRLVVLTFDDSVKSHYTVAAPLLERHGFSATFFITEGFSFGTNKAAYMTWEEIADLHRRGFEIGNHTRSHMSVTDTAIGRLEDEIEAIAARCVEHGIPRPVSFAWPGNSITEAALPILRRHGIRFARRGGSPEHPYAEGRGRAYEPGADHPLLIPSAGDARPAWKIDDFIRAAEQARDGRIAVIQLHGVPDDEHPWVSFPQDTFEKCIEWLAANGYRAIALRDLDRYVDPDVLPESPLNIIHARGCEVGRVRARDLGIAIGRFPIGRFNAITDVDGVRVGHVSIWEGDSIRTGVTAIVPHPGDLFRDRVPAAFDSLNGFGKPFGTVQIAELGELETPLLLGPTLSVPRIADAVIDHVLESDPGGTILSVNPAVGEVNDGYLSDIRARPIRKEHVREAIARASSGPVLEGSVGAGTGTRTLGYKGGIGTSSRRVEIGGKEHIVGVLVLTNFGGTLRIDGRPLATKADDRGDERSEPKPSKTASEMETERTAAFDRHGSCVLVVATDAPLDARQLRRVARRTFAGMARAGASFSHGSGDYAFAFSTARGARARDDLAADSALSPLFEAVADATEEAILNALLQARKVRGRDGRELEPVPIDRVRATVGTR